MSSFSRLRERPLLTLSIVALAALFSVGCSSSKVDSGTTSNPLGAYEPIIGNSGTGGSLIDGSTNAPGSLKEPLISVPEGSIEGHDNAPMLTNQHPGWQQSSCLTCHNGSSNNPDHNYSDDKLCYLCHGTNGLPGFNDTTPPVLSAVTVNPTESTVSISWKSDEDCVSYLILKTTAGDKMRFPVSTTYTTTHKKTISGLQSNTEYYYELVCSDKSGNETKSSSFSSYMKFTTKSKTTVPSSDPGNSGDDDNSGNEDLGTTYVQGLTAKAVGEGQFTVSFKTAYKPQRIDWYTYDKDKKRLRTDDISVRNDNTYEDVYDLGLSNPGTYYLRIKLFKQGSSDSDWSNYLKITVK